jgi:hypothetical protein
MGIKEDKTIVPLGAWTSESWKTVDKMINKLNNPNKKIAPNNLGK